MKGPVQKMQAAPSTCQTFETTAIESSEYFGSQSLTRSATRIANNSTPSLSDHTWVSNHLQEFPSGTDVFDKTDHL